MAAIAVAAMMATVSSVPNVLTNSSDMATSNHGRRPRQESDSRPRGAPWMAARRNLFVFFCGPLGRCFFLQECVSYALWGAREPRLACHVSQFFHVDALEPNQHGRISIEVRGRKVYARLACEQRLLHFEPVGSHS